MKCLTPTHTHGMSGHPLYRSWQGWKRRCLEDGIAIPPECRTWESWENARPIPEDSWRHNVRYRVGLLDPAGAFEPANIGWVPIDTTTRYVITYGGMYLVGRDRSKTGFVFDGDMGNSKRYPSKVGANRAANALDAKGYSVDVLEVK